MISPRIDWCDGGCCLGWLLVVYSISESCEALRFCFAESREVVGAVTNKKHNILSHVPFVLSLFLDDTYCTERANLLEFGRSYAAKDVLIG